MDWLRLALGFLAWLGVGWLLLAAAIGRPGRLGWPLALASAFTLGVGATSVVLFVASIAGVGWAHPWMFVVPWLLLCPFVVVARRRTERRPVAEVYSPALSMSRPGVAEVSILLALVVVFNVATVWMLALDKPVWNYDALSRWMFKAKAFYAEGSVLPYYADLERGVTQPHYPPLVSLASTWIYMVLGREDDRLVKALFAAVFLFLNLAVYGAARRRASVVIALLATAIFSSLPSFTYLDDPAGVGAASALADVPLALIGMVAAALLLEWLASGRGSFLALASGLCGLAVWTKQEGALLLVLIPVLAVMTRLRSGVREVLVASAAASLPGLVVLAPWYVFQRGVPITDDVYYPVDFGLQRLLDNADRVPVIAERFLQEFSWWSVWNGFWPLVLVAVLLAPRALRRNGGGVLLLLVVGQMAAYFLVYVLDDFLGTGAYEKKMEVTITRLFMHLAPLAAVLLARQLESVAEDVVMGHPKKGAGAEPESSAPRPF